MPRECQTNSDPRSNSAPADSDDVVVQRDCGVQREHGHEARCEQNQPRVSQSQVGAIARATGDQLRRPARQGDFSTRSITGATVAITPARNTACSSTEQSGAGPPVNFTAMHADGSSG
jgi:hypothetical protein